MKDKIYFIINSLNGGGAEHVAARISNQLVQHYDMKILTLRPFTDNDYNFSGDKVSLSAYYKGISWFSKIRSIAKKIDEMAIEDKPIFMISFLQNSNLCLMMTKYKCKKIVSIRNYIEYQYSGYKLLMWKFFVKKYFKRADYVVSVSKLINDEMSEKYGIPQKKCVCIYNPYDLDNISKQANMELPERYKEFFEKTVICNVGHLSKQKGQFHLVRILPELKKIIPNIGLVIIGNKESEYANKLKLLAKDLGVEDLVLFTGIEKNPFTFIKKSFCFVFPSLYEGFPNALAEAMAIGIPVIACDCKSGPREILTSTNGKQYGFLLDDEQYDWLPKTEKLTENEMKIINIISELYHNEVMYNKYCNLSLVRSEDFSINTIMEEWYKLLSK